MKKLLRACLLFVPFVLFVAAVNFYADPANVLRPGYEKAVAEILAGGQNASNIRNMDDRALIREYAAIAPFDIGTLVLGSSHSMQITKETTGDEATFCAGVTGADLRDCISIWRLMKESGQRPKRVVLAVDSWMFAQGCLEGRAMTDGYFRFCKEYGAKALATSVNWQGTLEKVSQIVSIPYFQSSVDYLKKGLHKQRDPVPTLEEYTDTDIRRADGSYGYNLALRTVADEADAHARAADYIRVKPQLMRDFDGISPVLQQQFELFLDEMQADGVQVALFLSPYHNDYYRHMAAQADNYREILGVEELVRGIAAQRGIPVVGSYDPEQCGLTIFDFYDGMHCSSESVARFYPRDLFQS